MPQKRKVVKLSEFQYHKNKMSSFSHIKLVSQKLMRQLSVEQVNSYHGKNMQGIMVVVFMRKNIQFKLVNTLP